MSYDVSIIIPCFNKVEYTLRCLQSLVEHTPAQRYQVVIVDNASSDQTPQLCAGLDGDVVVIRNEVNQGFAKACNQGAAAATGRHLLFLNNDTEAMPGWLEPLLAALDSEPDVGAVGARLLFPDLTLQHAGVSTYEIEGQLQVTASHRFYRQPRDHGPANVRTDLEVVTGACAAFRRVAFEDAGGFHEGYWNGNEDVDLCIALRIAGWRVVYEPASVLLHHESVSGPERWRKVDDNVRLLQSRWGGRYVPELLVVPDVATRPHPGRCGTEVHVTGRAAEPAVLHATIEAARAAVRAGESVVVDPALEPDRALLGGPVRSGSPDPAAGHRLTLAPGVILQRDSLDRMMECVGQVGALGPVLSDGRGAQSPDRWLGAAMPAADDARRAALAAHGQDAALVERLDPRCVLRRLDAPAGQPHAVLGAAYARVLASTALPV